MNNVDFVIQAKGYNLVKRTNRYRVIVNFKGKKAYFGSYETEEEARKVYVEEKNKYLTSLGLTDLLLKE
jgi:hypothetical protein